MNTDAPGDDARHLLEHQRDVVVQRLLPVIDAIDRKRHAVTDAVQNVLPTRAEIARIPRRDRVILIAAGAALSGVTFVALSWVRHRLVERRKPMRRLATAVMSLALARRRGSMLNVLARSVGGFVLSAASSFVRERLAQALAAHEESDRAIEAVLEMPPPPEHSPLEPPPLPAAALSAASRNSGTIPGMPKPPIRSDV